MLLTISALSPVMEVSTVFRVNVASPSQTQPASQDADTVDLAGTSVVIMSRNTPLIAEATGKQGLQYRLLKHSYVNPTRGTPFELHICYVDPNDPTDQPFVLQIKTDEQAPNPQPNRSDITVTLQSNRPIVLTYDTPISCTLQPGSTYNRSSGELTLNIDNLPTDET